MSAASQPMHVRPPRRDLPLRVGTRGSPLALVQTRLFLALLRGFCPVLRDMNVFEEQPIRTTGDVVQDRKLAEIGGKGLFAKEIHEALLERRIDFAVHSLKDLETMLPDGVVLACLLRREDARDVLIVGSGAASSHPSALPAPRARHEIAESACHSGESGNPAAAVDPRFRGDDENDRGDGENDAVVSECLLSEAGPWRTLPVGARVGTASARRQAQLLHVRPDLRIVTLRGNVQTRLAKLEHGDADATVLALAGLRRMGLEDPAWVVLEPEQMVPAAGQGVIGVTVRADDGELRELLAAITDPDAQVTGTAERALLGTLDGSCRTPIGAYACVSGAGRVHLTGLVARPDGSFLLRRELEGMAADAQRIGVELGTALRADSPADLFE